MTSSTLTLEALKEHFGVILEAAEGIHGRFDAPLLEGDRFTTLEEALRSFEVTLPLIGSFSAGKSSLINALLGTRTLKTKLTPTTAVPTEIRYGSPARALVSQADGRIVEMDVEACRDLETSVEATPLIRLYLDNPRLQAYPGVVLVDIPGLESGLDTHTRAIRDYMPRSVAYLLTAEVEFGLTEHVLEFLSELKLNGAMNQVAVALTKADKKTPEQVEEILAHNRERVERLLGHSEFQIFATSTRQAGQPGLESLLFRLQSETLAIFCERHAPSLRTLLRTLADYLVRRLHYAEADTAELDRAIAEAQQHLEDLERSLDKEMKALAGALERATENVVHQVHGLLSDEAPRLAAIGRNQEEFNRKLNTLVRQAAMTGIRDELEPLAQQSMERIGRQLEEEFGELKYEVDAPSGGRQFDILDEIYNRLPLLPLPLAELYELVASGLRSLFGIGQQGPSEDELRSQMEAHIRTKIIPQVLPEVEERLTTAASSIRMGVEETLRNRIAEQGKLYRSALEQSQRDRDVKVDEAEGLRKAIESDLASLKELEDNLVQLVELAIGTERLQALRADMADLPRLEVAG